MKRYLYKGFTFYRIEDIFMGNYYIVVKDGEQIMPNDNYYPSSVLQTKEAINEFLRRKC